MKNWWDILGVEQDADLRSIKRAYAAKLKTIRQDEDPQGFMEVRAAYDEAQAAIKYREMYPEEWQRQFGEGEPLEVSQSDSETHDTQAEDISGDQQETGLDVDAPDLEKPTLPNEHYSSTVVQLVGEVEDLMKSPWGANNIDSWTALLDDNRLDDIDVFSDFENAMLNYLLNIHEFFDEGANVPSKLDPAIAQLLFERFGWQEKRNSVHVNPMVFDWLAHKFFKPQDGTTYAPIDTLPKDIGGSLPNNNLDWGHNNYTEPQYQRQHRRKPTPGQDKFTQWFDGGGKTVAIVAVVLFFIAAVISGQSSSNYSSSNEDINRAIHIGKNMPDLSLDCDRYEIFSRRIGEKKMIANGIEDLDFFVEDAKKASEEFRIEGRNKEGLSITEPIILAPPPELTSGNPNWQATNNQEAKVQEILRKREAECQTQRKIKEVQELLDKFQKNN